MNYGIITDTGPHARVKSSFLVALNFMFGTSEISVYSNKYVSYI